jgi:putative transposase
MRDLAVLFLHLLATVARLAGPGGARAVVAESVLVKHQLLILNRSRKRSPNLRLADRMIAGVCALLMRRDGPLDASHRGLWRARRRG